MSISHDSPGTGKYGPDLEFLDAAPISGSLASSDLVNVWQSVLDPTENKRTKRLESACVTYLEPMTSIKDSVRTIDSGHEGDRAFLLPVDKLRSILVLFSFTFVFLLLLKVICSRSRHSAPACRLCGDVKLARASPCRLVWVQRLVKRP